MLVALAGAVGCAHAPPAPAPRGWSVTLGDAAVVAVLPTQNLAGGRAPVAAVNEALRARLAATGARIAPAADVERILVQHRIRWSGGVDQAAAAALREGVGAAAVLVSSVDAYGTEAPPRFALTVRLVRTDEPPSIAWMDRVAVAGNDEPGLLARGVVSRVDVLQARAIDAIVASIERGGGATGCGGGSRFAPRRFSRSRLLDDPARRSVAILPFLNRTGRRDASEVVPLELARQLRAAGAFSVVEPGLVRRELLAKRLILEGGVSFDAAAAAVANLEADLVLSGEIFAYQEGAGGGVPVVDYAVHVLDRRTQRLVFSSTTRATGDDGVWFFGAGRVNDAADLTCRTARELVDRLAGERAPAHTLAASR